MMLRKKFKATIPSIQPYDGMKFEVIRELNKEEKGNYSGRMYKIKLEDGKVIEAYRSEIYFPVDDDGYFFKWHTDDIIDALDANNLPTTDKNIQTFLDNNLRDFISIQCENGNETLVDLIKQSKDKYENYKSKQAI